MMKPFAVNDNAQFNTSQRTALDEVEMKDDQNYQHLDMK